MRARYTFSGFPGVAVLLAALLVTAAIVFYAFAQRYEFLPQPLRHGGEWLGLFRTDRLTGEACPWDYHEQRCRYLGQGRSL